MFLNTPKKFAEWFNQKHPGAYRPMPRTADFRQETQGRRLEDVVAEDPDYLRWIAGANFSAEVRGIANRALNGEFINSREILQELMATYGLSGVDIIHQIHRELYKISYLSPTEKADLANIVGEYDFRLSEGANEDIQLSALLAQFTKFCKSRTSS